MQVKSTQHKLLASPSRSLVTYQKQNLKFGNIISCFKIEID